MTTERQVVHDKSYFVDEAGDGILFDRKGKMIIGNPGCSNFFMVGLADVVLPAALDADLSLLRAELMNDPILKGVRQMDPARHQTAMYFHAKDDPVEVRREVFKVLLQHDIKFSAVVKCKWSVLTYVRNRNRVEPGYRYHPNDLYDFVIRRLFKQRVHRHRAYRVASAIRGDRKRTAEFRQAVESARACFVAEKQIETASGLEILASRPEDESGLQAVDYFLWGLQRVYERRDDPGCDRYLNALWDAGKVSLVVDADDTRRNDYGVYYSRKRPLQAAALKKVEEYRIG